MLQTILKEITTLNDFAATHADLAGSVMASLVGNLATQVRTCESMSVTDATTLLSKIGATQLPSDTKKSLSVDVAARLASSIGGTPAKVTSQSFANMETYLTKNDWAVLDAPGESGVIKQSVILDRMRHINLQFPDEQSVRHIVVCCALLAHTEMPTAAERYEMVAAVKLALRPRKGAERSTELITKYPADPSLMPPAIYKGYGADVPICRGIRGLNEVHIPLRSSSKHLRAAKAPHESDGNAAQMMYQFMASLAQQQAPRFVKPQMPLKLLPPGLPIRALADGEVTTPTKTTSDSGGDSVQTSPSDAAAAVTPSAVATSPAAPPVGAHSASASAGGSLHVPRRVGANDVDKVLATSAAAFAQRAALKIKDKVHDDHHGGDEAKEEDEEAEEQPRGVKRTATQATAKAKAKGKAKAAPAAKAKAKAKANAKVPAAKTTTTKAVAKKAASKATPKPPMPRVDGKSQPGPTRYGGGVIYVSFGKQAFRVIPGPGVKVDKAMHWTQFNSKSAAWAAALEYVDNYA